MSIGMEEASFFLSLDFFPLLLERTGMLIQYGLCLHRAPQLLVGLGLQLPGGKAIWQGLLQRGPVVGVGVGGWGSG